jgi:hypothetical protein
MRAMCVFCHTYRNVTLKAALEQKDQFFFGHTYRNVTLKAVLEPKDHMQIFRV